MLVLFGEGVRGVWVMWESSCRWKLRRVWDEQQAREDVCGTKVRRCVKSGLYLYTLSAEGGMGACDRDAVSAQAMALCELLAGSGG